MYRSVLRPFAILLLPIVVACNFAVAANADETPKGGSLTVLNYVTGWIHDAVGYHPALFMMVENTSGRDLSNTPIRLQARFTDLQTAEVSIGRKEIRRDLKPHQQCSLSIAGTQAYELPFEVDLWPVVEAKVMCRVGTVGDEGTETLMISKVEAKTHTEDEAFQSLNQATSYAPRSGVANGAGNYTSAGRPKPLKRKDAPAAPERPLVATAERASGASARPTSTSTPPTEFANASLNLLNSKSLPGLGDDFYRFEQKFGMPQEIDAKHSDWTWAKYRDSSSGVEIISGARDHKGSVDVVIARIPKHAALDEMKVANAARSLSGNLRSQQLSAPTKSVRYLPSGRLEVVTRTANDYRVICFEPSDQSDNSFILVLSRRHQDIEPLLTSQAQKVSLLKCLRFLE